MLLKYNSQTPSLLAMLAGAAKSSNSETSGKPDPTLLIGREIIRCAVCVDYNYLSLTFLI